MTLIPTILCGGAGSRLWPVSRELHPKPFIRLDDGQSLLQKAFVRGASLPDVSEILTVTNRELYFKIDEEFIPVNTQQVPTTFILEPFGRNTAAAIAMSALHVSKEYGDDALLLVLAADHLIADQQAFQTAVQEATTLAMSGSLVTFGITPSEPHTGYGYIESSGHDVLRFVEKPTLELAETYLATGQFLWNSGMFLFTAKAILTAMEQCCPDILSAAKTCFAASRTIQSDASQQILLQEASFGLIPDDSIDYAVMEKANTVSVVACDMGWTDVGSWTVLGDLVSPDEHGNRITGDTCLHDVTNCTISTENRLVGAIGVDRLLIIDTPDALLVADQSRAQDVKHIYAQLKQQDHDVHKVHRTVYRPWGAYTVLEESKNFKIKRIIVKPHASLSLQMHHHRSEHWIVVSGTAEVVNGDTTFLVGTNESTYIPAGHKHRLSNPGILDLVMIEVQSGQYLGEDDIVRFEDSYGRVEEVV
ncbi:MAG: mannose-1-phosphate guanylyltransferase/mannose-6-phosphate isomerase [Gammaproteobacteria bacterium]|nr:mannose-1-phosphate guanylyltransferase/mannose-6-phosphate isomerase [Gammaproteobacteria bacterium]